MELLFDTTDLRETFRAAELELKRREDERDFNDEMAGRPNGKIPRFLSAEDRKTREEERRGEGSSRRRAENLSRLQMLLASNPAYAKLYADTMGLLGDAEDATDRAIVKAQAALDAAQTRRQETLDRAARLPDGTRVFKDKWGQVWTEHGQQLSEADSSGIEWRSDCPSYEAFVEVSESVRDRLTRLEVLQGYRVDTLGRIRDRMMDHDNPPSQKEMEQFKREIHEKMPPEVHAERQANYQPVAKIEDQPAAIPVRTL